MSTGNVCATEGCDKPATLQCPTCRQKGLAPSFFCSQECFKKSWATHKTKHVVAEQLAALASKSVSDERFAGYMFTGKLRPGTVTPMRTVPPEIPRPDYAETGVPLSERQRAGNAIVIHNAEEIEIMREVCRMAREVLDNAAKMVAPGVTTEEIDKAIHEDIISRGAYPSPLNYRGFPKSCCTSINEAICHGIPDSRPLENGDIVNIDVTVYYKGFHGDINETYFVGEVSDTAKRLVQATYECLEEAIKMVKPGRLYRDIGGAITKQASKYGFQVVRTYCGHGVGRLFHTAPNVPHYARNKAVGVMKPGHIFTIEPMINEGTWKDTLWPDDWTATTRDGKLSAQFEHTMLVTEDGVEVLTARTSDSYSYPWLSPSSSS
ncbi:Methionine aminopeptidase 1 [Balamuthia mandrillaris]